MKADAAKDATHDASKDAPASPNDWSCLGHVNVGPPAKPTLNLKLSPVDVVMDTGIPNVMVDACAANDGPCATPVATATTDSTGVAILPVPAGAKGFTGYWQSMPTGYILTKDFLNVPYVDDILTDGRQAFSQSDVQILLASGGLTPDPSKGIVGFQMQDCTSRYLHQHAPGPSFITSALASGVSVTISPPGPQVFYFLGDTVSTTATATDKSGQGGFNDVPVGWVTITATLVSTGQVIGTAHMYSQAGVLSGVSFVPDH